MSQGSRTRAKAWPRPPPKCGRSPCPTSARRGPVHIRPSGNTPSCPSTAIDNSQTLVSNTGQTPATASTVSSDYAQAFTTGSNTGGYQLTAVQIVVSPGNVTPAQTVTIRADASNRPATTSLGTLTNPVPLGSGINTFAATGPGIGLKANTTYWVVVDLTAGSHSVKRTTSDAEDDGAAAGWNISDGSLTQQDNEWTTSTSSGMIAIVGYETTDYDLDDDGLIEIASGSQLNAVRWDLDGDGAVDETANQSGYDTEFPDPVQGMGCPTAGCTGYELTADIDLGVAPHNADTGWTPIGGAGGRFPGDPRGQRTHRLRTDHQRPHRRKVSVFSVLSEERRHGQKPGDHPAVHSRRRCRRGRRA